MIVPAGAKSWVSVAAASHFPIQNLPYGTARIESRNFAATRIGDPYSGGSISGPESGAFGSLIELTWRDRDKITFEETGEERTFLEDADKVLFSG